MKKKLTWGDQSGLTLIEVLVAAFLILIIFFGLAEFYSRGRRHLGYEEDRRKATAVAQDRIDGIRRDYTYDELPDLDNTDTTYVVENRDYVVFHEISPGDPEEQATTVKLTVTWHVRLQSDTIERSHEVTTILGRSLHDEDEEGE